MVAITRYSSSSSSQDLHSTAFMLLYTHPHARVGSGWTCANTSRCRMQWRVTREARRVHERKKCRHLADASSLWSIFASTGGSSNVVVVEETSELWSLLLWAGRVWTRCAKRIPNLSLSLFLCPCSLPIPPFPRKAVKTVRTNHWQHAVSLHFAFSQRESWFVVSMHLL